MKQKLVGISFNPIDDKTIKVGTEVKVWHDNDNKYSSRAIAVSYKNGDDIKLLGHIGEKNNEQHSAIFEHLPIHAKICRMARLSEGEKFGSFKVGEITSLEVEFPMPTDDDGLIKSFNEPDVKLKFEPIAHKYTDKGKELIGCSTYVKRWIKEFDADTIAPRYANSLGVKTEDVLGMWNSGGTVSADFGTAIHQALEHYEKYRELGEIIREKKDLKYNKALPTHPVLKGIVEAWLDRFPLMWKNLENPVATEALVTNIERGLCGRLDRLFIIDKERKICRVQDYKISVNCEAEDNRNKFLGQMAELPPNKLSEYQLKMSFYARLLELSGWTVSGLDAFVYDGEWKHYPLDAIKLDF